MATITTTPITPNQIPALKIPAIAWQLLSVKLNTSKEKNTDLKLNLVMLCFYFKD